MENFELPREQSTRGAVSFNDAQEQYLNNYDCRRVLAALEFPRCSRSPTLIAELLELSVDEVMVALESLIVLGIVEMSSNRYQKIDAHKFTKEKISSDSFVAITTRMLSNMEDNNSFFNQGVFATNKQVLRELAQDVRDAIKRAHEKTYETNNFDCIGSYSFATLLDVTEKGDLNA